MYNELKKEIIKNNGGTYKSDLTNANLTNGYMVSITGYEYITQDINDAIKKMVEYGEIIKDKKGYFVGAWIDTQDNNKIYIDISKRLTHRRDAEETARKNKQKAYFDIKALDSVYLDYEVVFYSVYKNVYNKLGELIDQTFKKGYDTSKEIPRVYRQDTKTYFILKDYINIQEL